MKKTLLCALAAVLLAGCATTLPEHEPQSTGQPGEITPRLPGGLPKRCLNAREKWLLPEKPQESAISVTGSDVARRSCAAWSRRIAM